MTEVEQAATSQHPPVLTVNGRGDIIGDTSAIPAETLEKLQSPEGRAQIRQMYRKQFGTGRRETRPAIEVKQEQRDFRHLCPPGMSSTEFRKLRRTYMREQTKAALKGLRHASN